MKSHKKVTMKQLIFSMDPLLFWRNLATQPSRDGAEGENLCLQGRADDGLEIKAFYQVEF